MIQTEPTTIALALLAVVVLGLAVWMALRWRRSRKSELQQLLNEVSYDSLIDFFIPDGNGGEIHIDHLLLMPRGLLLLETKDVRGTVFAGDRMDMWSATDQGARLTFDNPIPILQERAAAVAQLVPGVPLEYRILFVNQVSFPKGHPDSVATVDELRKEFETGAVVDGSSAFSGQWQIIRSAASVD